MVYYTYHVTNLLTAPNFTSGKIWVWCDSRAIAPTAVEPEIALVTAIKGECNAGATPHTTLHDKNNATVVEQKFASTFQFIAWTTLSWWFKT
jgi:hypothetical protein